MNNIMSNFVYLKGTSIEKYYRDLVKALVKGEMDIETLKEIEGDDE